VDATPRATSVKIPTDFLAAAAGSSVALLTTPGLFDNLDTEVELSTEDIEVIKSLYDGGYKTKTLYYYGDIAATTSASDPTWFPIMIFDAAGAMNSSFQTAVDDAYDLNLGAVIVTSLSTTISRKLSITLSNYEVTGGKLSATKATDMPFGSFNSEKGNFTSLTLSGQYHRRR
jgi:hypothetical protein